MDATSNWKKAISSKTEQNVIHLMIPRDFQLLWWLCYPKRSVASRSPDLTSPDFFLCGYLKDREYKNRAWTLAELCEAITNEIWDNNRETLRKTSQNMVWRTVVPGYRRTTFSTYVLRNLPKVLYNSGHIAHINYYWFRTYESLKVFSFIWIALYIIWKKFV